MFILQWGIVLKVELRKRIEEAFAMINECFDIAYSNDIVKSAHGWGDSILETIDEVVRAYKAGVAKIDKKLSNLNYE